MNSLKFTRLLVISAVTVAFSAPGWADSKKDVDQELLMKLHQGNLQEIAIGKLAQEKGESKRVRDFGVTLEKDHQQADQKVMSLAKSLNYDLSRPDTSKMNQTLDSLKKLNGTEFDQKFKSLTMMDHHHDIQDVSQTIPKLNHAEVKTFAKELLPTLEKHEKISKQLPQVNAYAMR